jgi:hypothetical protein
VPGVRPVLSAPLLAELLELEHLDHGQLVGGVEFAAHYLCDGHAQRVAAMRSRFVTPYALSTELNEWGD